MGQVKNTDFTLHLYNKIDEHKMGNDFYDFVDDNDL